MTLRVTHVFLQRGSSSLAAIRLTYSDSHMTHRSFDKAEIIGSEEYGKELMRLKPPHSIDVMPPSLFTQQFPNLGLAGLQPLLRAVCSDHRYGKMTVWDENSATVLAWEITLETTGETSLLPIPAAQIYEPIYGNLLPDKLVYPKRAA